MEDFLFFVNLYYPRNLFSIFVIYHVVVFSSQLIFGNFIIISVFR